MKRPAAIMMLCLLCFAAGAQSSKQASKAKLEQEIAILDKQLKENEKKSSSALNSLNLARKKVSTSKRLVDASNREIKALDDSISIKTKEIESLNSRLDTLTFYYGKLVRNAYINRDSRVWYMYILSSENLGQGIRRFDYFKNLAGQLRLQASRIKEYRASLSSEKKALEEMKGKAESLRTSQQKQLNKLKAAETQSQKVVNQLQRDKAKYQKQLATKRKQVEALNREINKMIGKNGTRSSNPVDIKLSKGFSENEGKLPWPVDAGSVVESFGEHYHPVYKSVKLPFNNGVNIATDKGAKVKAVFDGVVRQVIVMPGYNQCVLVQHGDFFTFYCKLGSVKVKAGDKVKTGQVLGTVETINGETELHFQLWEGRTPQNPELWLRY